MKYQFQVGLSIMIWIEKLFYVYKTQLQMGRHIDGWYKHDKSHKGSTRVVRKTT